MKKTYLTTSIAYTNAPPHIGYALELVQADSYARFKRSIGEDVWFLTGTDEHGLKINQKAKELGIDTIDFCNNTSAMFLKLIKELNISNNDFIRTTDQEKHWPSVIKLWNDLVENGDIYEKEYEGQYCVGCEAFIAPRDIVDGMCAIHKKAPEKVKENNYFFRLSKYSNQILECLEKDIIKVTPQSRKNEMISFIKSGLEDVSFSRPKDKVGWGIPVPGDDNQLIYVWADALTNYISAISDNLNDYWPADVHFVGKDISKFHILIWPAMLMSLGLSLPKNIFIHGFITVDGQKMSKSLGNVIDPFELIEKYGADAFRYYFLREITPTEDGDFSYLKFQERYNADLVGGLGNLVARINAMAKKVSIEGLVIEKEITDFVNNVRSQRDEAMESFKFSVALASIWELISFADKYIEENKPWEKDAKNKEQVICNLIHLIKSIGELIAPFMPKTSSNILNNVSGHLFERYVD